MTKVLEIDVGNTNAKWRVLNAAREIQTRGHIANYAWDELNKILPQVDKVRMASVADKGLEDFLRSQTKVENIFIAKTTEECAGLKNSYQDPARMGVDRWLAMLAAYTSCNKKCYVIDCGSAVTVDCVNKDGKHEGGYIVQGLTMLQKNLLKRTAQIKVDENLAGFNNSFGKSTDEAVAYGAYSMLNTWLNTFVEKAHQEKAAIYLTGGDIESLFSADLYKSHYVQDLVLDGLAILETGDAIEK